MSVKGYASCNNVCLRDIKTCEWRDLELLYEYRKQHSVDFSCQARALLFAKRLSNSKNYFIAHTVGAPLLID